MDVFITTTRHEVSCVPRDNINSGPFTLIVEEWRPGLWRVNGGAGFYDAQGVLEPGYMGRQPGTEEEAEAYRLGHEAWRVAREFTETQALSLAIRLAPGLKTYNGKTVQDALEDAKPDQAVSAQETGSFHVDDSKEASSERPEERPDHECDRSLIYVPVYFCWQCGANGYKVRWAWD